MGRVYKALLPAVNKVVALKRLSPTEHMLNLLGKKRVEEMFLAEAKTLARIRHPHIASILDFDRDAQGRPFFVMEYLCLNLGLLIGEDYIMESPTRPLPPERAARIADQVLSGLDRLHYANILHRDIKPYNVLLSDDEAPVKLIDFGLSRLRGETRAIPDQFKVGTPYYAPPEQQEDPNNVDERADLFSTGVLIWRMLTGTLPPEAETPRPPGELNSVLGHFWDDFLLKAVARDVRSRYSDCRSMRSALQHALGNWQRHRDAVCRLPPDAAPSSRPGAPIELRKSPVKVRKKEARQIFGLNELWRPVRLRESRFEKYAPDLVRDRDYGRIWQQSGSRYPLDWQEAADYIETLNQSATGGRRNWRLPTVDELICLIRPASDLGDYCAPPVFDADRQRLWSADRKSFTAAWFADTGLGFVGDLDFTCRCFVRAVSDQDEEAA